MNNKLKYNPTKPLTEDELYSLSESEMFEYLDSKAEYLAQFAEPLDEYHTKHYATATKGKSLSDEELKNAKKWGKKGNEFRTDRISEAAKKMKKPQINAKVKKTRRDWID